MSTDPKRIVASGYDDVADVYLERFGFSTVRRKWVGRLIDALPVGGGQVLDLGCGAGIPVARDLAALGHAVVGVDGSAQQVVRARRNVPEAMFIEADMCEVAFEAGSFDAVGAFYSITHIPPIQQGPLIANIAAWLRPGGTLVASFGTGAAGEWTGEWLGTTMFFGHNGEAKTLGYLADSGVRVRASSVEKQDNEEAAFMWIEAVKDR
ncbi:MULTISPECIES: class I SAM-dependent methyltransferase [Rhodomicrobium]|uniref:class I SAM-dependent methyltransferase n=1 Tax=Rhodomicrobium TaxID=1068 RepID=UPI000B4B6ECC|nr:MULTISPECIES: class I SAM-dependent methyltransferase [Rhodomicrobium]